MKNQQYRVAESMPKWQHQRCSSTTAATILLHSQIKRTSYSIVDDKASIIEKVYCDPAGFGSLQNTFKEVRKADPSITIGQVKERLEKNTHRKTNLNGFNSYVSPRPKHEHQVDLFFMADLKDEQQKFKAALCAIDSFSRFLTVAPLKSKSESDFLAGVMEAFRNLGGKPLVIYSDQEGAWNGKYVQQYLKEEKIKLIMTLNHAPIAERAIGTIKNMLYKRLEFEPHRPWYGDLLQQVVESTALSG